jgi:oxaloacetate decarboxylase gamma subunit
MNELIRDGLNLVVLGMGAVFIFLGLLVAVTTIMSKLVSRWAADPAPITKPALPANPQASDSTDTDKRLLAVIAAALHQHRSRHK